jgi:hypothetical protein
VAEKVKPGAGNTESGECTVYTHSEEIESAAAGTGGLLRCAAHCVISKIEKQRKKYTQKTGFRFFRIKKINFSRV